MTALVYFVISSHYAHKVYSYSSQLGLEFSQSYSLPCQSFCPVLVKTEFTITLAYFISCYNHCLLLSQPWQAHLKKCGQENNVLPIQLIEIARQQEQYQQEMESTSHQTKERAKGRPNEDGQKKTGQARKKRKVNQDLRYSTPHS